MSVAETTGRVGRSDPTETAQAHTRGLLLAGAVAGPLWLAVSLVQVLTREGFDLTRYPLSMLSLGDVGWILQREI